MIPVILSGGSGTRLWPLSRELYPKQFLSIGVSGPSMLQSTLERVSGIEDAGAPVIVCNSEHRFLVAEQLRAKAISPAAMVLEPCGRNTAPAVAIAALLQPADAQLLVMPADHVLHDLAAFHYALSVARPAAAQGKLVTFGIVPDSPQTGYGYIRAATAEAGSEVYPVAEFVEKPDAKTAAQYLATGQYFWNSGMFLFQASTYLQQLARHAPDILKACQQALQHARRDLDFIRLDAEAFQRCRSESIDYAVMEKTDQAVVVPLQAGWNDIGSWESMWQVQSRDENGNVLHGDVISQDVRDSYIHAQSRLIAAVGIDNLVIIETGDAVLVMDKTRTQEVKQVVSILHKDNRHEAKAHQCVSRPWGSYECIDRAERFQVKHISVKPGEKLSLQLHHHRAEHWIVVSGTARITRGEESFILSENQSTYIPLGVLHRLENPGRIPLELIEVQSGTYLGEDDIVRFADTYGRTEG